MKRPDVSINWQEAEGDFGDGGWYIACEHVDPNHTTMLLVNWNEDEVICPDCGEVWHIMKEQKTILVGLRKNQRTQEEADAA